MRLPLSEEDLAFREEMRGFLTTLVPEETRRTVLADGEPTEEQYVDAMRVLDAGRRDRRLRDGRSARLRRGLRWPTG